MQYDCAPRLEWAVPGGEAPQVVSVKDLVMTQSGVRDVDAVRPMIAHARAGGIFKGDESKKWGGLVVLVVFEDQRVYVFDGHHRVLAVYLGRQDQCLRREEFMIVPNATFEMNNSVVWSRGLVYPYDILTEVRLPQYFEYRERVFEIREEDGEAAAERYIQASKHLYCTERTFELVHDMARALGLLGDGS